MGVGCTLTPLTVPERRKRLWVESTSTLIDSLSTTGTSIGAAEANSTQVNPQAAEAAAIAAEAFRKSRRFSVSTIAVSLDLDELSERRSASDASYSRLMQPAKPVGRPPSAPVL